jgi:hypothetical protein
MTKPVSLSRQYGSVEAARGILTGAKSKPRPSELAMILHDLNDAVNTLRWVEANREAILKARGQA